MDEESSDAVEPRVVTCGDLTRLEAFLELDPAMEPIRGVRLSIETDDAVVSLSFHRVIEFRVNLGSCPHCLVQLAIKDISSRQWERVRFHIFNEEQDPDIEFYCESFESSSSLRDGGH